MGRLTTKDCKSVEGENLKLVVNSTSDDAMVLELHNSNYNTEKWGKIKTFVMLLMFIGLSSSLNISNIVILIIATILLLVNLYLILQLVDKGDNERQIDVESESNPFLLPLPETISIVRKYSLQKTTTKAFGRQETSAIPCAELKSLVINEVFDNVRNARPWDCNPVNNSSLLYSKEPSS